MSYNVNIAFVDLKPFSKKNAKDIWLENATRKTNKQKTNQKDYRQIMKNKKMFSPTLHIHTQNIEQKI